MQAFIVFTCNDVICRVKINKYIDYYWFIVEFYFPFAILRQKKNVIVPVNVAVLRTIFKNIYLSIFCIVTFK